MPAQKILQQNKIVIIADNREFTSRVVRELALNDCVVQPQQLLVADYILSDRVAVERKTAGDFVSSVFDQRLFDQVSSLKASFARPLLIIEGYDIYSQRNVHPNSLRGALASIAIDYALPILWTENESETAALLFWMAKREQLDLGRTVAIRAEKRTSTLAQQQEFLVAGLPDVNTTRARSLLSHFGTPEKVFRASEERLQKVAGIGAVLAKRIRDILETEYKQPKESVPST